MRGADSVQITDNENRLQTYAQEIVALTKHKLSISSDTNIHPRLAMKISLSFMSVGATVYDIIIAEWQ